MISCLYSRAVSELERIAAAEVLVHAGSARLVRLLRFVTIEMDHAVFCDEDGVLLWEGWPDDAYLLPSMAVIRAI